MVSAAADEVEILGLCRSGNLQGSPPKSLALTQRHRVAFFEFAFFWATVGLGLRPWGPFCRLLGRRVPYWASLDWKKRGAESFLGDRDERGTTRRGSASEAPSSSSQRSRTTGCGGEAEAGHQRTPPPEKPGSTREVGDSGRRRGDFGRGRKNWARSWQEGAAAACSGSVRCGVSMSKRTG